MNQENIPQEVIHVLNRIADMNEEAYIVGGALRDYILNKTICDWDIATSLLPDEIEKAFVDVNRVATGKKFGTITVFIGKLPIEITTYRIEDDYMDFRHPTKVEFTSNIYEDLRRRDFTMNALAFNPLLKENQFIDPYGGRSDIENRLIRAVDEPGQRFFEDPLRMMRAIRFVAELGFDIEENTLSSISQNCHLIENISAERIRDELNRTLMGEFAEDGVTLLYSTGLQAHILPESVDCLDNAIVEDIASSLALCHRDIVERLCLFFIWTIQVEDRSIILNKILRDLRYDNKTRYNVVKVLSTVDMHLDPNDRRIKYQIRKLMGSIGVENTLRVLQLRKLFNNNPKGLNSIVAEILDSQDPIFKSDLAIDGHDIIALGIGGNNSRDIGKALDIAYDWVLEDPNLNRREILMDRLSMICLD